MGITKVLQVEKRADKAGWEVQQNRTVAVLLDKGAVVSAQDNHGRTARDMAKERGLEHAIKALNGEERSPASHLL
jgi:hypothetical protein